MRRLKKLFVALAVVLLLAGGGAYAAIRHKHAGHIRPVTDARIEATPARLERGGYLVNQVLACGGCHTARATGNLVTDGERADAFLGGGNWFPAEELGRPWIPNITPDPETGIGRWSDDEILRVLRDGVRADGRFLLPMMPFIAYQSLCDEDALSVVAYLRSVPPYRQEKPRVPLGLGFVPRMLFQQVGVQMHAPVGSVPPPDRSDRVAYGRYVVSIAACADCHGLTAKGPRPIGDPLYMAGSDEAFTGAGLGKVWARNLTPDPETGLGRYSAAAIKQAIRNGVRLDGKRMAPPMAIMVPHYTGMTDDDLDAIVAFLKSVPAVRRSVPERQLGESMRALYDVTPPAPG